MVFSRTLITSLFLTATAATTCAVECQEEIGTYSTDELASILLELATPIPDLAALTAGVINPSLQNGVQLRKICGSCADYPNDDVCPDWVHGFDVPHSGLLISPLSTSSNEATLAAGTNMLNIQFHGAIRNPEAAPSSVGVPSSIFAGAGFDIFLGLVYTATTGTYTLL